MTQQDDSYHCSYLYSVLASDLCVYTTHIKQHRDSVKLSCDDQSRWNGNTSLGQTGGGMYFCKYVQ